MMPDEIAAVVDTTRVVVDLAGFQLAHHASWLIVSTVLSFSAFVACAIVVDGARRKRMGLGVVSAAVGGAVAISLAPIVLGVYGRWMPELGLRVSEGSLLVAAAGAGVGALLLAVPVVLVSSVRPRSSWVVSGVALVAIVLGFVAVGRAQSERRAIVTALRQATPIPRMVFGGQGPGDPLPEVQVGRTRAIAPERVWELESSVTLFPSETSSTSLPAKNENFWHLQEVRATLRAQSAGEHETTVVAHHGIVRIEQQVRFAAVNDSAPAAFPLSPGQRFNWARVSGPRGIVESTNAALANKTSKAKSPPKVDVSAIVLDERIEDGFRIARVQVAVDGVTSTTDVYARNGNLVRSAGGAFVTVNAGDVCSASFLGFDDCRCTTRGITRCVKFDADNLGAFMRIGLAVATMGISEVMGACSTCGSGHEEGMLLMP